jgi:hypothetical protein
MAGFDSRPNYWKEAALEARAERDEASNKLCQAEQYIARLEKKLLDQAQELARRCSHPLANRVIEETDHGLREYCSLCGGDVKDQLLSELPLIEISL